MREKYEGNKTEGKKNERNYEKYEGKTGEKKGRN